MHCPYEYHFERERGYGFQTSSQSLPYNNGIMYTVHQQKLEGWDENKKVKVKVPCSVSDTLWKASYTQYIYDCS